MRFFQTPVNPAWLIKSACPHGSRTPESHKMFSELRSPSGQLCSAPTFFTSYHVVNDQQANQTAARAIRARVRQRTSFSFSGYIRHITFSKPSLLSRAPSPHIERGCALGKIATRSGCHLRMPLVEPIDSEFTRWILAHAPVKR